MLTVIRLAWGIFSSLLAICLPTISNWQILALIGGPILLSIFLEELSRYLYIRQLGS